MSSKPVQQNGEDPPKDPAQTDQAGSAAVDLSGAAEGPYKPGLACSAADEGKAAAPDTTHAPTAPAAIPDSNAAATEAAVAGAATAGEASGAEAAVAAPLSRSQQKKMAKHAAYQEKKAARKVGERAAKRVKQEVKHSEVRARLAAMSPEEKAAWDAQRMQKREVRRALAFCAPVLPWCQRAERLDGHPLQHACMCMRPAAVAA